MAGDPKKKMAGAALVSLLVAALCSCSSRGGAAGSLDFTLVNATGLTLRAIYVSPHDSAGWEENVLGDDEVEDGVSVQIRFSPEEKTAAWDLRAEDRDGNCAEWKNLNLPEISRITLRLREGVAIAEAE